MSDIIETTGNGLLSRDEAVVLVGWSGYRDVELIEGVHELLMALRAEPEPGTEVIQLTPELTRVGWQFTCFALNQELAYVQGLASKGRVDQAMDRLQSSTFPLLGIMAKMGNAPHAPSQFPVRNPL